LGLHQGFLKSKYKFLPEAFAKIEELAALQLEYCKQQMEEEE
jgi:hypothetical protein